MAVHSAPQLKVKGAKRQRRCIDRTTSALANSDGLHFLPPQYTLLPGLFTTTSDQSIVFGFGLEDDSGVPSSRREAPCSGCEMGVGWSLRLAITTRAYPRLSPLASPPPHLFVARRALFDKWQRGHGIRTPPSCVRPFYFLICLYL